LINAGVTNASHTLLAGASIVADTLAIVDVSMTALLPPLSGYSRPS